MFHFWSYPCDIYFVFLGTDSHSHSCPPAKSNAAHDQPSSSGPMLGEHCGDTAGEETAGGGGGGRANGAQERRRGAYLCK